MGEKKIQDVNAHTQRNKEIVESTSPVRQGWRRFVPKRKVLERTSVRGARPVSSQTPPVKQVNRAQAKRDLLAKARKRREERRRQRGR